MGREFLGKEAKTAGSQESAHRLREVQGSEIEETGMFRILSCWVSEVQGWVRNLKGFRPQPNTRYLDICAI